MKRKPIKTYEGLYEVTEEGEVFSLRRHKFLKTYRGANYIQVFLSKAGISRLFLVHRLVADAFVGEIPVGMIVNHRDGNKHNNHFLNLEIVTYSENNQHARRTGLNPTLYGSGTSNAKLSESAIPLIREFIKNGVTQGEVAKFFAVTQPLISKILHRVVWSQVP